MLRFTYPHESIVNTDITDMIHQNDCSLVHDLIHNIISWYVLMLDNSCRGDSILHNFRPGISSLHYFIYIYSVTYPGFAWLIRRVLGLMVEFIGPLYNWLQQFTNHYLTHCHLPPTGHSTWTILTTNWTPLYSFNSDLRLTVPSYNSMARTPRKTPSSVVNNACLLVRYIAMDVLLLRSYASRTFLSSRCLAMGICVTIYFMSHV
jgi:hypothetical protein